MAKSSTHNYILNTLESGYAWAKMEESERSQKIRHNIQGKLLTGPQKLCGRMTDYLNILKYTDADQYRIFDNLGVLVPNTILNGIKNGKMPQRFAARSSLDSACL